MRMSLRRLVQLSLLAALVSCVSSVAYGQNTVRFAIAVDPLGAARDLFFESLSALQPPTKLADEDDFTTDTISVAMPFSAPPTEDGVVRQEWSDGTASSFPIVLSAYAPPSVPLMLFQSPGDAVPTEDEVRSDCTNRAAEPISTAFEMFFACRAHAFRLEKDGQLLESADYIYRAALAGWFNANYRLFVDPFCRRPNANPECASPLRVSPYGADPDLILRLRKVIELRRPVADWDPLRVPDVVNFLTYVDQRALELVGLVPALVGADRIEEALEINERALDAIESIGDDNAFRVTKDLLQQNMNVLVR